MGNDTKIAGEGIGEEGGLGKSCLGDEFLKHGSDMQLYALFKLIFYSFKQSVSRTALNL